MLEVAGNTRVYKITLYALGSVSFVVVVAFSVVVYYCNKRRSKNLPKPGETMVLLEHSSILSTVFRLLGLEAKVQLISRDTQLVNFVRAFSVSTF